MKGLYSINDLKNLIVENLHRIGDEYITVIGGYTYLFKIKSFDDSRVTLIADFAWHNPADSHSGEYYININELNDQERFIKAQKF